ncbi:hypothetical protein [Costertonia aggregata]|uniref:Uncharacterized protein n=1 Tax=Costertonia aggregata TaxID=343403 RepID=A0A7H9AR69_9FLAO|nr:hypothetical protein [Costertonia aggregata]QLG45930.1 hypothetical protein HYG79_11405 [Costertonia aggregata]
MKSTYSKTIRLVYLVFLLFGATVTSQEDKGFIPPSIDDEDIPIVKEELPVPEDDQDYTVRFFKGITDGVESRIAIKGLGYILRSSMVHVISEDGRKLDVKIVKNDWEDIHREGATKNGEYKVNFRTALQFGIIISSPEKGIPFVVAVSAGRELFPASNLFVDASTMKSVSSNEIMDTEGNTNATTSSAASESSSTFTYYIIPIAILVLGIIVFLFFRKKRKGAATVIALLFFIPMAEAGIVQGLGNSISGKTIANVAEKLLDAVGKEYGSGRRNHYDVLSPSDTDFEPLLDPAGQPSLPTSCNETARRSEQNYGGEDSQSKNSPNSSSSGTSDGEPDTSDSNEKDENIDEALAKAEERKERGLKQAKEIRNTMIEAQLSTFNTSNQAITQQYNADIRNANGDPNAIASATERYQNDINSITRALERGRSNASSNYTTSVSEVMSGYAREVAAIQQRQNDSGDSSNNDGSENFGDGKDKDRSDKKDPDRNQDKQDQVDASKDGGNGTKSSEVDNKDGVSEEEGSENKEGCDCLARAYDNLHEQRYRLEKLLKIGQHTKKVTDFGLSFGDNFSGIHPVSGLAWQKERAKVLKSIEEFDKTYKNKHNELTQRLYNVLLEIDACEKKLGEENWYSKYGFIYHEFMKQRYATYK